MKRITLAEYLGKPTERDMEVVLNQDEYKLGSSVENFTQVTIPTFGLGDYVIEQGNDKVFVMDQYGRPGKLSVFRIAKPLEQEVKPEQKTEHTPGVLIAENYTLVMAERKGRILATCNSFGFSDKEGKANAERIVKCWNSHDELVRALELAKDIMTTYNLMNSKAGYEIEESLKKAT